MLICSSTTFELYSFLRKYISPDLFRSLIGQVLLDLLEVALWVHPCMCSQLVTACIGSNFVGKRMPSCFFIEKNMLDWVLSRKFVCFTVSTYGTLMRKCAKREVSSLWLSSVDIGGSAAEFLNLLSAKQAFKQIFDCSFLGFAVIWIENFVSWTIFWMNSMTYAGFSCF